MARWWWRIEDYLVNDEQPPPNKSDTLSPVRGVQSYIRELPTSVDPQLIPHDLNTDAVIVQARINFGGSFSDISALGGSWQSVDRNTVQLNLPGGLTNFPITVVVLG